MLSHCIIVLVCLIINLEVNEAWKAIPYGSCSLCWSIKLIRDVKFQLYTRQNPHMPYTLEIGNETNLANSQFHPEHQTIIYIHGFDESASSESPTAILNAYLNRTMYNVILVDWANLAVAPFYNYAVQNSEKVGPYVARFVNWLESQNRINMETLHVIGFSLGAQVAGFMGKTLAPKKVGRITGLDPAAPLFLPKCITCRLDKSDAIFVDVIHTSANHGAPGILNPIGHVDFYPNRGFKQPGCEHDDAGNIICSHRRAWVFYVESILNPNGFPASRCQILEMAIENNCTKDIDAFMGFSVNKNTRGIFTLKTNSNPPFATDLSESIQVNAPQTKEGDSKSVSKFINCKRKFRDEMMKKNKKNEDIYRYLHRESYKNV